MQSGFAYVKVFGDSLQPSVLWESGARFAKEDGKRHFHMNCPTSMLQKQ